MGFGDAVGFLSVVGGGKAREPVAVKDFPRVTHRYEFWLPLAVAK